LDGANDLHGGGFLRLLDEAGFQGFHRDPLALHLPAGQFDAYALHVRTEDALGLLHELQADAAALFALTFMDDVAALDWAFAGDDTNARHVFEKSLLLVDF
jgi:hypothetical protein